jgi:hypothetical protein
MTARDLSQASGALAATIHNLRVWGYALPVLEKLSEARIPVIILKGLPQIEDLYGGPGARRTADVDVLVPARYAAEALAVLAGAGWHPRDAATLQWLITSQGDSAAASRPWHMQSPPNPITCSIDLHFDHMPRTPKPTLDPGVWERAVRLQRDGVEFLVLNQEDQLLFLCYHFVTDRLPLHKLQDIELLLGRSAEMDWDRIARRAHQTGVTIAVYLTCRMAARHATGPVPDDWRRVTPAARLRTSVLAAVLDRYPGLMSTRFWGLVWLLAHDRPWDMRVVWRHIFFPDRVTIAADYLGHWPSWDEYLTQLGRIYLHRIRKSFGRA